MKWTCVYAFLREWTGMGFELGVRRRLNEIEAMLSSGCEVAVRVAAYERHDLEQAMATWRA